MSRILTSLVLVALVVSSAVAQPPAGPPAEMKKFDKIVGYWKGSGTSGTPQGQKVPWTAVNHARPVMGGQFVRDDVLITIEAGPMKMELAFINIYGWDAHRKTYVSYQIGNNGVMQVTDITWTDDNTMVLMSVGESMGQRMSEYWKTTIKKDEISFAGKTTALDGTMFDSVAGSMKRAEKVDVDVYKAKAFMIQPGEEMKAAIKMAGHYTMDGEYAMTPGQPMVAFSGTETIRPIFGGLVLENIGVGDGYEGYGIMMWNEGRKVFDRYSFSSWGPHHTSDGYLIKGGIAFNTNAPFMGQRMLGRTKLMLDDKGKCAMSVGHAMMDDSDPYVSFKATYKLADGKGN